MLGSYVGGLPLTRLLEAASGASGKTTITWTGVLIQKSVPCCDGRWRTAASSSAHKVSGQPTSVHSEATVSNENSASGVALCLAGRTSIDQAACAILAQLVEREHVTARVLGPDSLSISGVARLNPEGVEALCIIYLGRQSLAVVRYAVRRLRKRFPGVPIAVCLWGSADLAPTIEAAQADVTVNSLREAVAFCANKDHSARAAARRSPSSSDGPVGAEAEKLARIYSINLTAF